MVFNSGVLNYPLYGVTEEKIRIIEGVALDTGNMQFIYGQIPQALMNPSY